MKEQEKKLIENLFDRLKKIESNTSEIDESADVFIKNLVQKQPSSAYYMIQTILIQETAIEKMNETIEDLKKQVSQLEAKVSMKKPSFLSGLFSKKQPSSSFSQKDSMRPNNDFTPMAHSTSAPMPFNTVQQPPSQNAGFLANALQTATGVAGGMIIGNVLMNAFKHTKSEDEIFNTARSSSEHDGTDHNREQNICYNTDSSTAHHEENNFTTQDEHALSLQKHDDEYYQCNSDSDMNHIHENEYADNIDANDDNFI